MTKQQVQQRVLQNGVPLDLDKFMWDEKTKTFSSGMCGLVIDFSDISGCTFKTGSDCTFDTGHGCTFKTGSGCTFKTGSDCTFDTGSGCTFDTGSGCTFKTGSDCTFDTGHGCTFDTGSGCTFKTGSDCTFDTWHGCTFDTGGDCVVVRRDTFEVIISNSKRIQLCPIGILGYLVGDNGKWYKDDVEHIIADGILSKVVRHIGNAYVVINYGEEKESFLVTDGTNFSHGETIEEAREGLMYKISDRDTSMYAGYTLDTVVSLEDGVRMYRKITGACESQTKSFVESLEKKESYSVKEIIEITDGRYNNNVFKEFFLNNRNETT